MPLKMLFVLIAMNLACVAMGEAPPTYADKSKLLIYLNQDGKETPITTLPEWQTRRAHILANFQIVAGDLPAKAKRVPLDPKIESTEDMGLYVRKKMSIAVEAGDRLPCYLLIPKKRSGPVPAVLCLHPTSKPLGKGIVIGQGTKFDRQYAVHLAERGYVTLAPDYVNMGEYKFDPYSNGYQSSTMKGIWNHQRCLDFLQSLPEVNPNSIGVIGHSLGGHNSIFLGVFDPRIKCVVSSCGFCAFPKYMKGDLTGWSHNGYMPKIKEVYSVDPKKMPFDFPELIGALAPKPFFVCAPINDANFDVSGVRDCIDAVRPIYALHQASERLRAVYPNAAHDFPDDARKEAYEFMDHWLKR
jgi:hypothetical protein